MNYEEALHYMDGRLRFGWKLGNDRIERACELLGNPQLKYRVIHIAGTKGKGSTTALCARILHEAGYSVGSYFSPYVYDVRERVQIGGEMISREEFALVMTEIRSVIDSFDESEWGPITEFELKTILSFTHFARRGVDFAVIEVGLGGRLNAT
ncbi:MAG: bifunctional folylpolyglutamate synthase/dihydrofolate synthase, partial [Armatimonadetes bacterium]|nr:bifunctional folylpolyglutamate synthase/dihydrofolate synthase [Armatimonadota bacterium]